MKIPNFEASECERVRSYLDSGLNYGILAETNHEVLKHLESCTQCARVREDRARVKAQLKRAVLNERAPEALSDRIGAIFGARAALH